jgi:hypothetical protein
MKITNNDKQREQSVQKFVDTYDKPDYINDIVVKFIPGGLSTYFMLEFKVNNNYKSKKSNQWMQDIAKDLMKYTPYFIAATKIIFEK